MINLLLLIIQTESAVVSVVETCRHGARAPIDYYVWDEGFWDQGLGELTQEGMRQQYLNGVEFRRRYIEEEAVISGVFNQTQVFVRSTNVNRTIMSAESQLMGFFPVGPNLSSEAMMQKAVPPFNISDLNSTIESLGMQALPNNFQPVPVHVVAQQYDNMLAGYTPLACPYLNIIMQSVQQSSHYQYLALTYTQSLQKQLYKVFNQMIEFEEAGWYGDVLFCDQFHGYPWPEGMTEDIFQQVLAIMNYSNSYVFDQGGAYLASSQFYSEVLKIFNGVISGNSTLNWGFFSAHDTTLIGFLRAIDLWDGNNPPFASTIIFELNEIGNNYFVRTIYNDEPLLVNGCPEMCPFNQFEAFLNSWIIPDVVAACQIPPGIEIIELKANPFITRGT